MFALKILERYEEKTLEQRPKPWSFAGFFSGIILPRYIGIVIRQYMDSHELTHVMRISKFLDPFSGPSSVLWIVHIVP